MKVKLFTDNDLDGTGCALLARFCFKIIDVEFCSPKNINERVKEFLKERKNLLYDQIYITDLSIKEDVAEIIENSGISNILILDHHNSASWLNKYKWATIKETLTDNKTCGTELFYEYVFKKYYNPTISFGQAATIGYFVELVRRYDTYDWKKLNDLKSKELNDLFLILGTNRFYKDYDIINDKLFGNRNALETKENFLIGLQQETTGNYIKGKLENIIPYKFKDYNVAVVYAENYSSELGNTLLDIHPEFDFVAIIDIAGGISFRGNGKVNLTEIAQSFGGGGHFDASGCPLDTKIQTKILDSIFKK